MKRTESGQPPGTARRPFPTVFLVAGDPSADVYGALLLHEVWKRLPQVRVRAIGGPRIRAAGVDIIADGSHFARIGIVDTLLVLPSAYRTYLRLKRLIRDERPSLVIGIDWGAANVRILDYARQLNVPTLYYIPPRCWDANASGSPQLIRCATQIATPFPWSAERLRAAGANVTFVGHPVLDAVRPTRSRDEVRRALGMGDEDTLIALLPGSRRMEIKYNLPVLLETARRVQQQRRLVRFAIAQAPTVKDAAVVRQLRRHPVEGLQVLKNETYNLLHACDLALVTSGTATLEAACLETPMIIVYAGPWFLRLQAALLTKLPSMIGLPNIIAQEMIVPEIYGERFTPENLTEATLQLLDNVERRETMRQRLKNVRQRLGDEGASARTADLVMELIAHERPATVVHHPS